MRQSRRTYRGTDGARGPVCGCRARPSVGVRGPVWTGRVRDGGDLLAPGTDTGVRPDGSVTSPHSHSVGRSSLRTPVNVVYKDGAPGYRSRESGRPQDFTGTGAGKYRSLPGTRHQDQGPLGSSTLDTPPESTVGDVNVHTCPHVSGGGGK